MKIIVEQSYWGDKYREEKLQLPFEKDVMEMLEYAGIKVAQQISNNYDATLKIAARGEVIGVAPYTFYVNGRWYETCKYFKASLKGTIQLETHDGILYDDSFEGTGLIPGGGNITIIMRDSTFRTAYNESFLGKLMQAIEKIFGVPPLIRALGSLQEYIRSNATAALVKIGTPAIQFLIVALKDTDVNVRSEAESTLKKITGKDFGQNQERWQKWWEENKEKFLKNK